MLDDEDFLMLRKMGRAIVAAIVWNRVGPGETQEEYDSNIVRSVETAERIIAEVGRAHGENK
jgi:hypothetical protein